tara:strand:- start:4860 stop:5222 length:363 start_codon:yes stop_codon:yes gene_type:complete
MDINNNIERKRQIFNKMKRSVKRKYKGCALVVADNSYTIQVDGKNIITPEWEDLRTSENVYDAWKNAYICEHWDRQKLKGNKIIANTIKNMVGNSSSLPRVESYEYHEDSTEIQDEDNLI